MHSFIPVMCIFILITIWACQYNNSVSCFIQQALLDNHILNYTFWGEGGGGETHLHSHIQHQNYSYNRVISHLITVQAHDQDMDASIAGRSTTKAMTLVVYLPVQNTYWFYNRMRKDYNGHTRMCLYCTDLHICTCIIVQSDFYNQHNSQPPAEMIV